MKRSVIRELAQRFQAALAAALGSQYADRDPIIRPAQDQRFGDYQCNAAMGLAKELKQKPREIAQRIVDHLDLADMCAEPQIAGPGFVNVRLKADWLARTLEGMLVDPRLGLPACQSPMRIVVDYSGPNIAKEMHVGHLRSMIIGDVIAAVQEFLGHDVIRQNHLGDWGTHIGMLIAHMFDQFDSTQIHSGDFEIADLDSFYRDAQKRYAGDEAFASQARAMVVALQGGDAAAVRAWRVWRAESMRHCEMIYSRFGVRLKAEHVRAESDYNTVLPDVVDELLTTKKLAVRDQGAVCIFLEGFKTKEGTPLPLIIQKSDGGYLYTTTDLAAIRFRVRELKAQRIIYLTDARQILHFQQVFSAVRAAGWDVLAGTDTRVSLEHITFGSVLGDDGSPLKTREGENVKLRDLLDEAVDHARSVVDAKNPDLPEDSRREVAEVVGVGAVKYADLSQNRVSDYVFSFDKMLALEGNTAPYMMYAYARIKSIERRGEIESGSLAKDARIELGTESERQLAKKLLQLADVLNDVADNSRPNILTSYLYDVSQAFSGFYENCPVLKAETDALKVSRLGLCDLTGRTLKLGLELLGIATLEQM